MKIKMLGKEAHEATVPMTATTAAVWCDKSHRRGDAVDTTTLMRSRRARGTSFRRSWSCEAGRGKPTVAHPDVVQRRRQEVDPLTAERDDELADGESDEVDGDDISAPDARSRRNDKERDECPTTIIIGLAVSQDVARHRRDFPLSELFIFAISDDGSFARYSYSHLQFM